MNRTGFINAALCSAVFALAIGLTEDSHGQQGATSTPATTGGTGTPSYQSPSTTADPAPANTTPATKVAGYKHPKLASGSTEDVGMRLVCVFDVSGSIDQKEYEVQLEAMATAIGSDDFKDAVFFKGGPESVALCVVDFGTSAELRIPWVDIREGDGAKLKLLANEIRALTRRESGSTSHSAALEKSLEVMQNCPWGARRSVVDIITDGKHNSGEDPKPYVEKLTAAGVTINALITTTSSEPDLEEWTRKNILTPADKEKPNGSALEPGFVKVVATQESTSNPGAIVEYNKAMEMAFRRKLILEVASIELDELRKQMAMNNRTPPLFPLPTLRPYGP